MVAPTKMQIRKATNRAWLWKWLNDHGEITITQMEDERLITKQRCYDILKDFMETYPGVLEREVYRPGRGSGLGGGLRYVYRFTPEWRDAA